MRNPGRAFLGVVLLATGVLILSCGDSDPSGPKPNPNPIPGWLKVRLNSPNSDDGGILFSVSGGQIDSIRSSYTDLYVSTGSATSKQVLVAGNLISGGVLVEVLVPDVERSADYSATPDQVAARDTYVQRQVSTVSLVIER